jgi:hypothetical protein
MIELMRLNYDRIAARKGGYQLLSTSNLYRTGGLVTSPGRAA